MSDYWKSIKKKEKVFKERLGIIYNNINLIAVL
jgi:hypothetical protein